MILQIVLYDVDFHKISVKKKITVYVFNAQTLKSVPIAALEKYLIWS